MPRPTLVFALALLMPCTLHAAPKTAKPLMLQALADELATPDAPLSKGQQIAVKRAESCLKQDSNWVRGQRDDVPVNQLYEMLSSAVVCWQGAEKKAASLGDEAAPVAWWLAARTRYMETFRSWVWAMDAKFANDKRHVCQRLAGASTEGVAGLKAVDGLAAKYEGAGAKALAFKVEEDTKSLVESISAEYKVQHCGG